MTYFKHIVVASSLVLLSACASLATEGSSQATDLGSSSASSVVDTVAANTYLEKNDAQVRVDIARGTGEHLEALAAHYQIKPEQQAAFGHLLQANFSTVFVETPAPLRGAKIAELLGSTS